MSAYASATTKAGRIAALKELLANDKRWAVRGLLAIYKHQTEEEKDIGGVVENNGVGFTGSDGDIMSSFASQQLKRGRLSDKQMVYVFKKMPKYAGQLDKIAQRSVG